MRGSEELERAILECPQNPDREFWEQIRKEADAGKAAATTSHERNRLWAIANLCDAASQYLLAYEAMKLGQHYDSWCALERSEIALQWASKNALVPSFAPLAHDLQSRVRRWQMLFPYQFFFSPAFRIKDWKCLICGKRSTPVDPCGHVVGHVYDGELCTRVITDAEFIEVSLVRDPVQKYSVAFVKGYEFDYSAVAYAVERTGGPFSDWDARWTYKKHKHEHFKDHDAFGPCPCNSGLRYEECCLRTEGVLLPHLEMTIEGESEYQEEVKFVGIRKREGKDAQE